MNAVDLHLDGDGAFPELADGRMVYHLGNETVIGVAALDAGTEEGRPSMAFKFDLPDGSSVLAEMTWRLFWSVAVAMRARFGEPE